MAFPLLALHVRVAVALFLATVGQYYSHSPPPAIPSEPPSLPVIITATPYFHVPVTRTFLAVKQTTTEPAFGLATVAVIVALTFMSVFSPRAFICALLVTLTVVCCNASIHVYHAGLARVVASTYASIASISTAAHDWVNDAYSWWSDVLSPVLVPLITHFYVNYALLNAQHHLDTLSYLYSFLLLALRNTRIFLSDDNHSLLHAQISELVTLCRLKIANSLERENEVITESIAGIEPTAAKDLIAEDSKASVLAETVLLQDSADIPEIATEALPFVLAPPTSFDTVDIINTEVEVESQLTATAGTVAEAADEEPEEVEADTSCSPPAHVGQPAESPDHLESSLPHAIPIVRPVKKNCRGLRVSKKNVAAKECDNDVPFAKADVEEDAVLQPFSIDGAALLEEPLMSNTIEGFEDESIRAQLTTSIPVHSTAGVTPSPNSQQPPLPSPVNSNNFPEPARNTKPAPAISYSLSPMLPDTPKCVAKIARGRSEPCSACMIPQPTARRAVSGARLIVARNEDPLDAPMQLIATMPPLPYASSSGDYERR